MEIVRQENEENGIVIVKTISDFLRQHTKTLESKAQPFLDLIQEMFQIMEQTVKDTFDTPAASTGPSAVPATPQHAQYSQSPRPGSPVSTSSSDIGTEQQQTKQLQKSTHSFKVLSECPIIVVSMFQSYRTVTQKNVKLFVPLIKNVLMLQAKPQEKAHAEAKARGETFTGVSKDIKNRAAFGDFITMQVKTMSFLAYLLRLYAQQLTDFLPTLPDVVIRMLKDCPRERSGARKELLVAIRHIINFNFRKIFLKKIDELLDEKTLIGDGLTVYETMRPLAYSMLADLIHHLRESLKKEQIRRTIEVYTKNLHDDFPGTSFQTMSAKLLLNMAESIAKLDSKEDARHFLIMILNAIGDKFAAMNRQYKNAVKISAQYVPPTIEATAENYLADKDERPDWDEIDIFNATPIKTSNPRERSSDPVQDNKFLFKNLLHGLKNLFYQLKNTNAPKPEGADESQYPSNWAELSSGFTAEELKVLIKLFREGCRVFRYYGTDKPTESQSLTTAELLAAQHMMTGGKDEKELLEAFATVFHHVDPATFFEVFHSEIPHLYEMCFEHAPLLHIAQFLLASEATSPNFCGMLLQFLMSKIDEVGTADTQKASILLRLFKLSFMAVTLFAPQNEQVLLPHVTKIATKAIELSTTAEEPNNYFLLLRSLFRSIGGGRFEHLYKELLPLLEMLLEVLNNLLEAARKPQDRDLFVELILTVPARLSNLLPHLSYLMRPLVVALRAGSDLVGQGLRTLELCVDNLTADYIDPIMAPVIDELMKGLWEHLKPAPYNHFHAHTTMRILGKLGGRNRKFLNGLPPLDYKPFTDDEASFDMRLNGTSKDRAFPAIVGVDVAITKLQETPKTPAAKSADSFHKRQAFKFVTSQIKLLIGFEQLPEDFAQLVRLQANDLAAGKFDIGDDLYEQSQRDKNATKRDVQQETLRKLLKACHFAQSIPELKEEATSWTHNLCTHFVLLEIGKSLAQYKHRMRPFDVNKGEGQVFIDSKVICDVIADSLASDNPEERAAAEQSLMVCREAAATVFGSAEKADKLYFFTLLSKTFSHNCHQEEWYQKAGGTLGIDILITKINPPLGDTWLVERHLEIVRCLMYVIKDMPPDITAKVRIHSEQMLETVIRRVVQTGLKKEDLANDKSKLFQLCKFLVLELAHINKHVRAITQRMFAILAETLGMEVGELVVTGKDPMLSLIFNKPLRALPFGIQIGYIDAITYCLQLPNVIEFNEQLTRLLMECLALADAEDETMAAKPLEYRNCEAIVSLRVGCINLLTIAQTFPEFGSAPSNHSRARIIAVFFKALYSKSQEVIDAADAGLKSIIGITSKLPKDLLQSGLRPILMNLQDPRKLNVDGLDGLARLLKLLTNYFKVEIGARLLDHMKTIADPAILRKVSFSLVEQNRQMKVIAAIINVFHLLPDAAVSFLQQLVEKVLYLESELRRTQTSPFREPLLKYLRLFAKEAWAYFAPKMNDLQHGRFWAQLLAGDDNQALRDAVMGDVAKLVEHGFELEKSDDAEKEKLRHVAAINGIHTAYALSMQAGSKDLLVKNENLRKAIFEAGKELECKVRDNTINASLRLAAEQAGDQVMQLLVIYLQQEANFEFFVDIVEAVTSAKLKASPFFFQFIYSNMIAVETTESWRPTVLKCIEFYANKNTSQKSKTFLFHNVVNPILAMDVMRNWDSLFEANNRGTKLVDRAMISAIEVKLWRPLTLEGEDQSLQATDHSRMELLQTTAFLLKYYTSLLSEARRFIIRFGWGWSKYLEDVVNKHAAYVAVAYFINHFETPTKLAVVVYNDLLKAHQNECRALVSQGLELLAPVLKKRMNVTEHRLPMWAYRPKKIIVEEAHTLQQLISIFNFLVRHPDIFYEVREALVPCIIPSLPRIAPPSSLSNESKKVALNIINMIWLWEEQAQQEVSMGSPQLPKEGSESPRALKRRQDGTPTPGKKKDIASPQLRWLLVKYLVQFITSVQERYPLAIPKLKEGQPGYVAPQPAPPNETCKMAVRMLYNLLKYPYWTDLDLNQLLSKVIGSILASDPAEDKQNEWLTKVLNTLQILKVLVNVKSDDWILEQIEQLKKLLEKVIRMEDISIQTALHDVDENMPDMKPLFARILEALPASQAEPKDANAATDAENDAVMEDSSSPASEFVTSMANIAAEALGNNNNLAGINILWSICQRRPQEINQHIPALMKAFTGKLAKEHLANVTLNPQMAGYRPDQQQMQQADPVEQEIQTGLMLKCIDILAARIEVLSENRRPYLSALASIVERSQSKEVCGKILDLAEEWVFNSDSGIPTLKEKVAVLSKMLFFEQRADQSLLTRFLELVIRVYEDPKVTRTELTVRLENAFLVGTRAQDVEMRNRFLGIFDKHISRSPNARLDYLLCHQDWSTLAESFWLSQVIQLLLGSLELQNPIALNREDFKTMPAITWFGTYEKDDRRKSLIIDDQFEAFMNQHKRFHAQLADIKLRDVMEPLGQLQHTDSTLATHIWTYLFPIFWSALPKDDRHDFEVNIAQLLPKDFHYRQLDKRPNCVQALLEGIVRAKPRIKCPPHVVKFLAKTYNVWYVAADYLEESAITPLVDSPSTRESNIDALVEIYAGLEETDLFYGTWRRRCQFVETNAALSNEQLGMWDRAQQMYEQAQIKARTGTLPFSQGEYMLWEDHWVLCAQKLQQWEVLLDFAKHENFNDLYLEASWRHPEQWTNNEMREQLENIIKSVSDAPTPRRTFFQAFMSLLKLHAKTESPADFNRSVDEAIQLSIRKWYQLPKRLTNGHIPLLQHFQHLVELHDAQVISNSLAQTNQGNLDVKSQELKMLLGTWRDRLPNFWDDINAWQDLVTWRQHIFQLINNVYLNILPQNQGNATNNSFAYRGYHETAWIINRFAHVARQHNLPDVCISQLSKIYTLPNIEIQEAFLKLREQAKCHYQNKNELNSGLEVINNTNLSYFAAQQKCEFYTLKGMFLNKLGQKIEANEAFGTAMYFDIKLPKAWAEWGRYHDQLFKEDPKNMACAASAVSCYLEAASQFKNAKTRKLLGRILWLLSLDDADRTLVKTFDSFKGDTPVWYWITFIPQLILDLSKSEAPIAAQLLKKIAKQYPQALYFQLRTAREDMHAAKRQQEAKEAKEKDMKERQARAKAAQLAGQGQQSPKQEGSQPPQGSPKQGSPPSRPNTAGGTAQRPNGEAGTPGVPVSNTPKQEPGAEAKPTPDGVSSATLMKPAKPWEYVDEITSALKTAFPLLAWSMEAIVETICKHFKSLPDEDAHRLIVALLNDGLTYVGRQPTLYAPEVKLPASTEANITRFAESVCPPHVRKSFILDFVAHKPTMYEYIQKLRKWRNRFEERLDRRPSPVNLESQTLHLSEFRFTKFEEVEIPGQYLEHRDKNQDFIRIERFMPDVDLVRGPNVSHRRLKIRGHDGSIHPFQIQHPAGRHSRREERISQLFRIFNSTLVKRKESRRRNLQFNLPVMVPLSPNVRMIEDDPSYTNLQSIYEDYCRRTGVGKDEPILYSIEKLRALQPVSVIPHSWSSGDVEHDLTRANQKNMEHANAIRLETFVAVQEKFCPPTITLDYFKETFSASFDDFWLFKRAFAYQFAAHAFMTYIFYMNLRYPHKFHISRASGKVWGIELFPAFAGQRAQFHNPEQVQIRLTPNLQTLMGPIVTEGIFAPSLMALARCLTEPEGELEMQLSIFVRDEVGFWFTQQHKNQPVDGLLREMVSVNSEQVVKRARSLANPPEGNNLPANQTVVDLVSSAVHPRSLCQSDVLWMPYL